MPLTSLFRRRADAATIHALYGAIVLAARAPEFYECWGVPDTLDGRFELIALHAFLVLRRLNREPETSFFSQGLFDVMFADFDRNLREMGASDLGVGRQVKEMAKSFYGRVRAYERGLQGDEALDQALRRNLFGTAKPSPAQVEGVAAYLRRQAATLDAAPAAALLRGELPLGRMEA